MVMNKKHTAHFLICCFFILSLPAFSQIQHKYWVKFTDKEGSPYTLSNPSEYLSPKSILRRTTYNIPLDASDLPVNPSYVSQVESVPDVTVLYASKWLNGVVITIPERSLAVNALNTIRALPFVTDTFKVKKYKLNIPEPAPLDADSPGFARQAQTGSSAYNYGGSYWQNAQLNVPCLHDQGFRGQGMTIAVMDAGFSRVDTYYIFDSLRSRGGIKGTQNFADGGTNVYLGGNHGTMVLSCLAANSPGRILGSAPMADYWLFRTEEPRETISEEYNWIRAAEFADSVGVDLITTSLGYTDFDDPVQNHSYATLNGRTAPMSIAANMAARKGIFVLNSAGNEGAGAWRYISVPGDADSICTVGAIDSIGQVAAFSSVGPTYDKRIKPEFVARGVGTWVSEGTYAGFPGNGTSFSTPVLTGAVACFWQAHRQFNNIKILDTLKKNASNHCAPNNSMGWGIPKMCPEKILIRSAATLEFKARHSGIKVRFIAMSPSAVSDSVYTQADGSYSIHLSSGAYRLEFSKDYYETTIYDGGDQSLLIDLCSSIKALHLKRDPAYPFTSEFDFVAYTDPLNTRLELRLSDLDYTAIHIKLTDLSGKTLFSSDVNPDQTRFGIDTATLADGIYLVSVKTSLGDKTKKVLKRK